MKLRCHLLQEALPIYRVGLGTPPLGSPSFLYFSVSAQSTSCGQCLRPRLFPPLNLMSLVFQSPGLSIRPAYGVIRKHYELSRMTEKHSWGLVNITVSLPVLMVTENLFQSLPLQSCWHTFYKACDRLRKDRSDAKAWEMTFCLNWHYMVEKLIEKKILMWFFSKKKTYELFCFV